MTTQPPPTKRKRKRRPRLKLQSVRHVYTFALRLPFVRGIFKRIATWRGLEAESKPTKLPAPKKKHPSSKKTRKKRKSKTGR